MQKAIEFGPACVQPTPSSRTSTPTSVPMSEDCLTLNIWAPTNARNAPVFFWIYGGALVGGREQGGALRRTHLADARHRRRVDQLSAGRAGLACASGTKHGIAARHLRQLRPARSDRGAALGQAQHRRLRRRCLERDHRGRIRGRPERDVPDGLSRGARPVREGDRRKRLHDLHARAERSQLRLRRPPRRAARSSPPRCMHRDIAAMRAMDAQKLTNAAAAAGFAPLGTIDGHVLPRQLVDVFDQGEQAPVPLLAGFNSGEIRSLSSSRPRRRRMRPSTKASSRPVSAISPMNSCASIRQPTCRRAYSPPRATRCTAGPPNVW